MILQLFIFVYLPLTALLMVITLGSVSLHRTAMRSMVGERDERAVRTAASALSAQIESRIDEIHGLGLRASMASRESLDEVLAASEYLLPNFPGGLAFLSQDGRLVASLGDMELWEDLAGGGEVGSQINFAWLLRTGHPSISSIFPHPESGEPYVLAVAPHGDLLAAGAFSPRDLAERILAGAFTPGHHTTVFLVDPTYQVLYTSNATVDSQEIRQHPGVLAALQGASGTVYLKDNGSELVVAYSPAPPAGWALVAQEAWEMVETPLLGTTQIAPLVLVPALLIALLALLFGARQVVRPLQELEARAAELAWGDFEAIGEPVGGIAEIRHLQAGLVHMAEKVKSAQQSLHGFIGAITAGQEEERRRLARELHDDTLQALIALKQRVQLFKMTANNGQTAHSLAEIETFTEQTIQNLRRLTRALRPIYLEDLGLAPALEMLAQETGQASGMRVGFHRSGRERRLTPAAELALYRIAQEALNNVARHAEAPRAAVQVIFTDEAVLLEVTDEGKGFQVPKSPAEFAPGGHFGLLGLYERAELIGASLVINSSPGQGTRIVVRLPDTSREAGAEGEETRKEVAV